MKLVPSIFAMCLFLGLSLEAISQSTFVKQKYVAWVTLRSSGEIMKGLITHLDDESISLISVHDLRKGAAAVPYEIGVEDIQILKIRKRGVTGTGFAIFGGVGFVLGYRATMYFGPVFATVGGLSTALYFGVIGWFIFSGREKFRIMGSREDYQKQYRGLMQKFIYKPTELERT